MKVRLYPTRMRDGKGILNKKVVRSYATCDLG